MKRGNEASMIALEMAIAVRRKAETTLIESPVRESQSNGHVERAVRIWGPVPDHEALRRTPNEEDGAQRKTAQYLARDVGRGRHQQVQSARQR